MAVLFGQGSSKIKQEKWTDDNWSNLCMLCKLISSSCAWRLLFSSMSYRSNIFMYNFYFYFQRYEPRFAFTFDRIVFLLFLDFWAQKLGNVGKYIIKITRTHLSLSITLMQELHIKLSYDGFPRKTFFGINTSHKLWEDDATNLQHGWLLWKMRPCTDLCRHFLCMMEAHFTRLFDNSADHSATWGQKW